ncbi:MAG: hypothetical protein ACRDH9_11175 [Actinomycetota bacterium]
MSELGPVLELIHTSPNRWRNLRAAGTEWVHTARNQKAWMRAISPGTAVMHFGDAGGEPPPEETSETWKVLIAKPDRARVQFGVGDEMVTALFVADTWWSWSPSRGGMTNRGDPNSGHGMGPGESLIDASHILPGVELEVVGRSTFIGRPVVEMVARPSEIDEEDEEARQLRDAASGLGSGGDEYRLLIDAEHGVLLRSEARFDSEPFRILEMTEVAFDEVFPEDTFKPPTEKPADPVASPRSMRLADLAEAVPFVLLVPERPPFGPPTATLEPADPLTGDPLRARITYLSPEPGNEIRLIELVESGDPLPERPEIEWTGGRTLGLGKDHRAHPTQSVVRLDKEGTHVELRSLSIDDAELRELALSLVPFAAS